MAIGLRSFEFVRALSGRNVELGPTWISVTATRNSSSGVEMFPGMFAVQATAGDSTIADGAATADTVPSASRLLLGMIHAVTDTKGNLRKPEGIIAATGAGGVLIVPARGNLFRGLQDDTTALTVPGSYGHTRGTSSNTGSTETFTPQYYTNDLLKRATYSGTLTTNAFVVTEKDPDTNNNGVLADGTTAAKLVYLFYVNDGFSVANI